MFRHNQKIDSSLILSASAELVEQSSPQSEVAISHWKVNQNTVNYQKNDSHTLSLYLKGGETSYRNDQPYNKGSPGKVTLMPQSHQSNWQINGEIEFSHLYFTDGILKQYAASTFECDVRFIELQDITYKNDHELQNLLLHYFLSNKENICHLFSGQILGQIFHHLITNYNGINLKENRFRGGLSNFHIRQTKVAINDHLDKKLTIKHLAKSVNLSPFHFARMFKLSLGESPAHFINRTRVEKVKQYLKTNACLADISAATGFCQQSHMSYQFKKMTGVTPRAYRAIINDNL